MHTTSDPQKNSVIRVAIGGPWNSLHPGLQHTMWADLVLSNQFDALIGINDSGIEFPLGAKSWEIAEDFTSVKFIIDSERRFPDGSSLNASDYKNSWLSSLTLIPRSANSSLLDVLYYLEGFDESKGAEQGLPGVVVVDDKTLLLKFKRPFRTVLQHLSGNRFSAFRQEGKRFSGTGSYIIEEKSDGSLLLIPNQAYARSKKLNSISVRHVPHSEMLSDFENDRLDVFAYAIGSRIPEAVLSSKKLKVVPGQEAMHGVAFLNGISGNLFSDAKLRLAFQYLFWDAMSSKEIESSIPTLLANPDPQTYLPVQAGRLDDVEVAELLEDGKKYVELLIKMSNLRPIEIIAASRQLRNALLKRGLSLAPEQETKNLDYFKLVYEGKGYDVLLGTISVAHGDPDGLYHALGKNGAILNPAAFRKTVSDLLENGRNIIGQEKLDEHYKTVSREILKEVPWVHTRFSRAAVVIREDRIVIDNFSLRRNEGHLDVFKLR